MTTKHYAETITLTPENNQTLLNLCGNCNENLQFIQQRYPIQITQRGYAFTLHGEHDAVKQACAILQMLYAEAAKQTLLTPHQIHLILQSLPPASPQKPTAMPPTLHANIRFKRGTITARGDNQVRYLQSILKHTINFGIGPAGTGKTYLAVACAVQALETASISRIVLVRPIVEAGEKLGFLPGDLAQKVHPYLRPLYDGLYEMLGSDRVTQLLEQDIIEIVPLAYMRGRSLNDSFIILDEAQNTTAEQMKMFLTRLGFNSKAVITGDITQIDLNNPRDSGLVSAIRILQGIEGISFSYFKASDIVRHPLVQSIVQAYAHYQSTTEKQSE